MVKTLTDLTDLRASGFGRPPPRHGLDLLWWFAQDCVRIDSNEQMIAQCDPENGAFGFRRFYNACNLLPYSPFSYLPYYEVGNLHSNNSLPYYVSMHYSGCLDESNTDRLIVSYSSSLNMFNRIYVTRHSDATNFDQNHTYCISIDLLKEIKRLNRNEFFREMRHAQIHVPQYNTHTQFRPQSLQSQRPHQSEWDDCTCSTIFALVVIVACLLLLSFMIQH